MMFSLGHLSLLMSLFVSALEKSNSSRVSIYPECSLLGGFDFGEVSNSEFLFDVILMEFYVCLGVNLMKVRNI